MNEKHLSKEEKERLWLEYRNIGCSGNQNCMYLPSMPPQENEENVVKGKTSQELFFNVKLSLDGFRNILRVVCKN